LTRIAATLIRPRVSEALLRLEGLYVVLFWGRTILPRQICCGNSHFAERDKRMDDDASLGALNLGSVVGGVVARPVFVVDLMVLLTSGVAGGDKINTWEDDDANN
jgi:hypothetical protein